MTPSSAELGNARSTSEVISSPKLLFVLPAGSCGEDWARKVLSPCLLHAEGNLLEPSLLSLHAEAGLD